VGVAAVYSFDVILRVKNKHFICNFILYVNLDFVAACLQQFHSIAHLALNDGLCNKGNLVPKLNSDYTVIVTYV